MSIASISSPTLTLQRSAAASHPAPPVAKAQAQAHVSQETLNPQARSQSAAEARREAMVQQQTPLEKAKVATSHLGIALTADGAALTAKVATAASDSIDATDVDDKPSGPEPMLTLKGLLAVWGDSNSPYDLNGDGTVGMSDLLLLLQNGGSMPMPDGKVEPITLKGLLGAWGTDHPTFDLNGDGVVDVSDLLILMQKLNSGDVGKRGGDADKLTPADLPVGLTSADLVAMTRANPAATDQSIKSLLSLMEDVDRA